MSHMGFEYQISMQRRHNHQKERANTTQEVLNKSFIASGLVERHMHSYLLRTCFDRDPRRTFPYVFGNWPVCFVLFPIQLFEEKALSEK